MGSKFDKVLHGFNTNVNYKGKVYHVQTEESGKLQPHIITHVFFQGNIVATEKTSYGYLLDRDRDNVDELVVKLMRKQHRQMIERLLAGNLFDTRHVKDSMDVGERERKVADELSGKGRKCSTSPSTGKKLKKRPSDFYTTLFKSKPAPIPLIPSVPERLGGDSRGGKKTDRQKIYFPGSDVSEEEDATEGREKNKTLEEIIADFLSENLLVDKKK